MATPNNQNKEVFDLNKDQEQAVIEFAKKAQELLRSQFMIQAALEMIDRDYMRENNWTEDQMKARIANRQGDAHKTQDITVPVVMPQVEAALAYYANVFCTGYPIFGVSGDPTMEDAAIQMETLIAENSISAKWVRQFLMFFRDGLKYNLHALECDWEQRTTYAIGTNAMYPNSAEPKKVLWNGNVIRRMDLYNTFFDPRVSPADIHEEGEFAGYTKVYSRIKLKKFINELFSDISADKAMKAFQEGPAPTATNGAAAAPFGYYIPLINPFPISDPSNLFNLDWWAWAQNNNPGKTGIQYKNAYSVTKLYGRILPADFGIKAPQENTPQVWRFIIVNGTTVLHAKRMSNVHGWIPMFFGQPLEDGLDYQTKSFASNVSDMQAIASSMWNGYIASKRRLVGDRVLYDPLRIREKDINDRNPAAKIPVRPGAYGKQVSEAVYQFPFHDEQTRSFLEGSEMVIKFGNLINGQNPAQQGQFVKGNKTRKEYEDIMGHGNNRNQMMAISTETQVFVPLKECIKLNHLQYQTDTVLINRDRKMEVKITMEDLRKAAIQLNVSDGMLPTDKIMGGEDFAVALQTMQAAPGLGAAYNMGPMFTYLMKTRGVDLSPFEKSPVQKDYEQKMGMWQQGRQEALAKGVAFDTPMPEMPEELKNPAPPPSPRAEALKQTQGS
jgi:hypothetical protein